MVKIVQPCKVCRKKTEIECSHVDCPNRPRISAMAPEYEAVNDRIVGSNGGSFKVPTTKD